MRRFTLILLLTAAPLAAAEPRRVVSLDGTWQLAEGKLDTRPTTWPATVPVPGLADMAAPPFAEVGTPASRGHREAFYYRRTFTIAEPLPAVARLKIHKACYGTRVWLNGQLLGDHRGSFTPGWFDAGPALRRDNELIVRVGADREANGRDVPDGWDFEKTRYLPGVYDHVELICSATPSVVRVQVVPLPGEGAVRVVAWLRAAAGEARCRPMVTIREARSGEFAGDAAVPEARVDSAGERRIEARVDLRRPRLWSPEDPFLYTARVDLGTDAATARFGLRSFRFDQRTGKAVLNGRFTFLRGTNVCIYRFFEDPLRGDKPWRREWVGWLHQAFRSMHWNAMRYCIGFPPDDWYDVADETGLLIQDEFPLWWVDRWPAELKREALERDYTEWLQERWNHPSVVIWDAQNETVSTETGAAIRAVRGQDLSDRPWDNGWSPPDRPTDVYEAHPYAYINPAFSLDSFARMSGRAGQPGELGGNVIPNSGSNPVIINEYGWLWLNRDGSPTTLSAGNYHNLLGDRADASARRKLYARLLAEKTEFWRVRRGAAGVLHFCGLGYSRAGGQTSDNFIDLERLSFEPYFKEYVGDAFAPLLGVLDFWLPELPAGAKLAIPVVVLNDLDEPRVEHVDVRLVRLGKTVWSDRARYLAPPRGTCALAFSLPVPAVGGSYELVAELAGADGRRVRSRRDLTVLTAAELAARRGLAVGCPVTASSVATRDGVTYSAELAVDGQRGTRWSSEFSDPQELTVDLGQAQTVGRAELLWEAAYGKSYRIEVSTDGQTWTEVYHTDDGHGGVENLPFTPVSARWVRFVGLERGTPFGYSLWEYRIFGR